MKRTMLALAAALSIVGCKKSAVESSVSNSSGKNASFQTLLAKMQVRYRLP
jgi:hypothetical protein